MWYVTKISKDSMTVNIYDNMETVNKDMSNILQTCECLCNNTDLLAYKSANNEFYFISMNQTSASICKITPTGKFDIDFSHDNINTGVYIEYVSNKEPEDCENTRPCVYFENETNDENNNLNAYIWSKPRDEDYSEKISFNPEYYK